MTEQVAQIVRQLHQRMDESIMEQLCKLVCYDEDYFNGLAAFIGKSYKETMVMLEALPLKQGADDDQP